MRFLIWRFGEFSKGNKDMKSNVVLSSILKHFLSTGKSHKYNTRYMCVLKDIHDDIIQVWAQASNSKFNPVLKYESTV